MEKEQSIELVRETQSQLADKFLFLAEWIVTFDNAKRRAGICKVTEKEISISNWHIKHNSIETVLDTLLHEFAHAIAFELYNDIGHGEHWKEIAYQIGATPKATGNFNLPDSPWRLVTCCDEAKKVEVIAARYRRNSRIKNYAIKGRPTTKGKLYYLRTEELKEFESGNVLFEQLNFIQ